MFLYFNSNIYSIFIYIYIEYIYIYICVYIYLSCIYIIIFIWLLIIYTYIFNFVHFYSCIIFVTGIPLKRSSVLNTQEINEGYICLNPSWNARLCVPFSDLVVVYFSNIISNYLFFFLLFLDKSLLCSLIHSKCIMI